jgi:hypothetical protein
MEFADFTLASRGYRPIRVSDLATKLEVGRHPKGSLDINSTIKIRRRA